ncbi:hypothetical protein [Blastomonas marina]|nr:hypothetical protein [Blastomonas marina]
MIATKPATTALDPGSPQTEALTPVAPWVLDYGENRCTMSRAFGREDAPIYLTLQKTTPGDLVDYAILGSDLRPNTREPVEAYFFPGDPVATIKSSYRVGRGDTEGLLFASKINLSGEAGADAELSASEIAALRNGKERAVEFFELRSGLREPLTFATGSMHEPLAALRACVDDLMRGHGVDPAVLEKATSRAKTKDPMRWLRAIVREVPGGRWNGTVTMTMIVDVEGKVEQCWSRLPEPGEGAAAFVCGQMMKRARFEPAQDEEGNPIKDYTNFSFTFSNR